MLFCYFTQCQHVFLGIESSGRISGIADEYGFRTGSYEFLELSHVRHFETIADIGVHGFQRDAVHECESVVVRVERLQHNDFISLVACNLQ